MINAYNSRDAKFEINFEMDLKEEGDGAHGLQLGGLFHQDGNSGSSAIGCLLQHFTLTASMHTFENLKIFDPEVLNC